MFLHFNYFNILLSVKIGRFQGPYSRGGKRTGIQHDHAEGDGFDSRSVQDLFVKVISLTSLGIEYLRACHTIYTCKMVIGRGSSQLITVEVLIEH